MDYEQYDDTVNDVSRDEEVESLLDNDELSISEASFMMGYNSA